VYALQAKAKPLGDPIMFKRFVWGTTFVVLLGTAVLLTPGTAHAQRRGWGWGSGGYDPWGYHSGSGNSVTGTTVAQPNRQYYPAETLIDTKAAGFVLRLPDANAEVWFENQKTKQQGRLREYVSGSLDPNSVYTFHIRARWTENGRPVEQARNIDARAGQQVVVDFNAPDQAKSPATTR
jgi:uncharacterized protein (TIGR03000 family)